MKNLNMTNSGKFLLSMIIVIFLSIPAKSQIPKDKQLHLGAGAVVAGWGYMLPTQSSGWKPLVYGLGSATIAGAGKELADMGGFGTPDWKDLRATVIGGVVSVGVIMGVKAIFKTHRTNKQRRFVFVP
ncbi:MAG: hypothetical protein IPJ37_14440 [Bacteroidales bacterium]|nr:hypothetical protein [Bacteroidales bacterium]